MNEVTLVADVADVGQVAPSSASVSDRQQLAKSSGLEAGQLTGGPLQMSDPRGQIENLEADRVAKYRL